MKVTQTRLRYLFDYDPLTGLFTRLVTVSQNAVIGDVAGAKSDDYIRIKIDSKSYLAHRLAWLYMTGEWPEFEVDHKNHNGVDNIFSNLRKATRVENMCNQTIRKTNKSGVLGVSWKTSNSKWVAQIVAYGKKKHLGLFDCFNDAVIARKMAEYSLNYHNNHGAAA